MSAAELKRNISNYRASEELLEASSLGERGEARDENGDDAPRVPEGERQVHEEGVERALARVVRLETVEDGRDDGRDLDGTSLGQRLGIRSEKQRLRTKSEKMNATM